MNTELLLILLTDLYSEKVENLSPLLLITCSKVLTSVSPVCTAVYTHQTTSGSSP
jgi:hypothetical protein